MAPSLWFLPPLVGLATQLIPLRRHWAALTHPSRLHFAQVAKDMLRGLLLGAVLWSDKYFLFLKAGDHFAVTSVYIALLPAVLAYNYYFVRLAPRFDASILELRRAMEDEPYDVLADRSRSVYQLVTRSLSRSAAVGARHRLPRHLDPHGTESRLGLAGGVDRRGVMAGHDVDAVLLQARLHRTERRPPSASAPSTWSAAWPPSSSSPSDRHRSWPSSDSTSSSWPSPSGPPWSTGGRPNTACSGVTPWPGEGRVVSPAGRAVDQGQEATASPRPTPGPTTRTWIPGLFPRATPPVSRRSTSPSWPNRPTRT